MEGKKDENGEKKKRIAVGPWGGKGGGAWDDGSYNGVREVALAYDGCIDSIRVVYDKNGKPFLAERHGNVRGSKTVEIKLRFPEEFLTSMSGYVNSINESNQVIRSITFKSNQRTFGPYGTQIGTPFSFPMEGGKIVGFKGRSGSYLDAIGCYISPLQSTNTYQKVLMKLTSCGNLENLSKAKKNSG